MSSDTIQTNRQQRSDHPECALHEPEFNALAFQF